MRPLCFRLPERGDKSNGISDPKRAAPEYKKPSTRHADGFSLFLQRIEAYFFLRVPTDTEQFVVQFDIVVVLFLSDGKSMIIS